MADPTTPDPTQPPVLPDVADAIITKLLDPALTSKYGKFLEQLLVDVVKQVLGLALYTAGEGGAIIAEGYAEAENTAAPAFNKLTAAAIGDLFGVSVQVPAGSGGRGNRAAAANAIGEMLFNAFGGAAAGAKSPDGELVPSDTPAKTFLTTMAQLSLEGWLEGWVMEMLSLGQIEKFGELDDKISHTLGLGRAAASVHGPIVKHMIVTPLDWKLSKEHRPTLLSASACAKQVARFPDQREKWLEDLRRQGYSEDRIEALLNDARERSPRQTCARSSVATTGAAKRASNTSAIKATAQKRPPTRSGWKGCAGSISWKIRKRTPSSARTYPETSITGRLPRCSRGPSRQQASARY
jgi:hypothetical protein